MRRAACLALTALLAVGVLAAGPKGAAPRTAASRYPAHATGSGIGVGAVRLTPEQVRRAFASDPSRCCMVVEVAVYPESGKPLEISLNDFTLRVAGTETAARPSSAKTLAALLQKTAASQRNVTVYPQVGVGYESGPRTCDPVSGERRGGGVHVSTGVGVGIGDASPGSTDRDREVMELELDEKGLPEGPATAPVAGYLYFPLQVKKKNVTWQLEYTGRGSRLVLLVLRRP